MNSTKYIFFDIDGTLLTSDGVVCDSTKKSLKLLQKKGHKIFINSGRARKMIPQILIDLNFDGYVCGTGSFVEYRNKVVFEQYFSKQQTEKVINTLSGYGIHFIMSASDACVGTGNSIPYFIEQFTHGKIKAEDVKDLSVIDDPFFDSIKPIVIDDDLDNYYKNHPKISDFVYIKSKYKIHQLQEIVGEGIRIEKASFKDPDECSGEITLSSHSKATGIQRLLDYFNANVDDAICIGDGFNDLDMLKYAGLSIAMGNSPDEIKKASDYTTSDINDDGIFNALEHFGLL